MTILLGYGSHGRDIEAIWNRDPLHADEHLDVYDSNFITGAFRIREAPTVANGVFIGINKPLERKALYEEYRKWHHHPNPGMGPEYNIVDPTAIVDRDRLGSGIVVAPNVCMLTDVSVGSHTHINYGAQMTRCNIGEFCTIAPGVTICGDVKIGDYTYIGAGATIANLVTIGNRCVVGAGAVVLKDVPDDTTVVGIPAKEINRV